ncbi:MAG: metal-binding protein [Microcoleaceae cyanobacterium]
MPSSRTHDRITLWSLPVVASLTYGQTRDSHLTLLVTGTFLFSGLMFGPDLDIYSHQFLRWGWLRWLWLPYQKSLRHRCFLSHGPFIGTAIRLLYLSSWLIVFCLTGYILFGRLWQIELNLETEVKGALIGLANNFREWLAIYIGLELGAMSHYLADWLSSQYKQLRKKGWINISLEIKTPRQKSHNVSGKSQVKKRSKKT